MPASTPQKFKSEFDPAEFGKLYRDMIKKIADVKGKALIPFVGMTGAGKSTTLNFLLGNQMRRIRDALTTKYEVATPLSGGKVAQVGHGASQTLFPETYEVADLSSNRSILLDTAGLGEDTRGQNVALCIALALKRISEEAIIKGVVVVIRQADITEPRAVNTRRLFKLLSELARENFKPEQIAFCVTGLTCAADDDTNEVKAVLLAAAKATADGMVQAQSSDDSEDAKREVAETVAALNLMQANNLFLMRDLDDLAKQAELRAAFFAYTASMPGLKHGLRPAMVDATYLKLLDWSKSLARQGVTQLAAVKEANARHAKLKKAVDTATRLERALSEQCARSAEAARALAEVQKRRILLSDQLRALSQRQNETVVQAVSTDIPVPKAGSGISGGLISAPFFSLPRGSHAIAVRSADPGVTLTTDQNGETTAVLHREVTGDGSVSSVVAVVSVEQKLREISEYKQALSELRTQVEHVTREEHALLLEKGRIDRQLSQTRVEIENAWTLLGVEIRRTDSVEDALSVLSERAAVLMEQLTEASEAKTGLELEIAPNLANYAFLQEIIQLAELTKKDSILAAFLDEYSVYSETPAPAERDDRVALAALHSPNGSATFSVALRALQESIRTSVPNPEPVFTLEHQLGL